MREVTVEVEQDGKVEEETVEIEITRMGLILNIVSEATGIEEHDLGYLSDEQLHILFLNTLDEAVPEAGIDVPE